MAEYQDSDDYVDLPPMVDAMVTAAKKKGPHVLETWICGKCENECFAYHPFSETMSCGFCNHPVASQVKRYLSIREQRVDGQ